MSRSVTAQPHESLRSVTEADVTVLGVYTWGWWWWGGLSRKSPYSFSPSIPFALPGVAQNIHPAMAEKNMPLGPYSTNTPVSGPLLSLQNLLSPAGRAVSSLFH